MKVLAVLVAALFIAACTEPPDQGSQEVSCGLPAQAPGEFVTIPAGIFTKGRAARYREEGPSQPFHLAAFDMLAHEVTNTGFAQFVEATGYVTDAERSVAGGRPGAGSAIVRIIGARRCCPLAAVSNSDMAYARRRRV